MELNEGDARAGEVCLTDVSTLSSVVWKVDRWLLAFRLWKEIVAS
jgi:hypothetical protein